MRQCASEQTMPLVDYFEATYVNGVERVARREADANHNVPAVVVHRVAPLFPPETWNVYEITIASEQRTNNLCEAWNFGFEQLVGHKHPSVWTLLDGLRQDCIMASTTIQQHALGMPPKKRVKHRTRLLQERLCNICIDYRKGSKTMPELLHAVANTIRF